MRSVPAIAFDYRPSRWLAGALIGTGTLAAAAVFASALPAWVRCVSAAVALAYAGLHVRRLTRPGFDHACWHSAGHWRLRCGDGEKPAELAAARAIGPLLVLVFRIGPRRTVAMPLLPDNCAADIRRRLRVRLARGADA